VRLLDLEGSHVDAIVPPDQHHVRAQAAHWHLLEKEALVANRCVDVREQSVAVVFDVCF
jgi:hypothetical protein